MKKFCAWLGLCPQSRDSGKTRKPARVRPGINRAAQALRLAARSLHRSRSALGAFYRRMRSRLGAPKAIVATAHKLARLVYARGGRDNLLSRSRSDKRSQVEPR